jgi:Fe-coproporphyrin III synthase
LKSLPIWDEALQSSGESHNLIAPTSHDPSASVSPPTHTAPEGWFKRLSREARRCASSPVSILRARRGLPQQPRVLTHTVTFGCNAKCVMCDSWQLPTSGDLTLAEIESIYRQLPTMDAVRLTGGEPFVRKDLHQIADLALRWLHPWLLHISSNGFLSDRIVDFCHSRSRHVPLELALSIDGVGDFHNEIRGNSLAWQKVWSTLTRLVDQQTALNLRLVVNQTVASNAGLVEYERLHELLSPLGIEHHLIIAYAESATYSIQRERVIEPSSTGTFDSFAQLDPVLLEKTLVVADAHARTLPWYRRWPRQYYLRGIRNRILSGHSSPNPLCQALHTHLRIFPNGDVPVCQFNSRIVGNLRLSNFESVWSAQETINQRAWVRRCEGCWAECENLPSALYTLDVLRSHAQPATSLTPAIS